MIENKAANEMKMNRLIRCLVIGFVALAICSCHGRRSSDKFTDTATSGVIPISADESFRDIIQQEIDVFESIYPQAGICPIYTNEVDAVDLLLKDSVRLAVTSRKLTDQEKEYLASKKFFPKEWNWILTIFPTRF